MCYMRATAAKPTVVVLAAANMCTASQARPFLLKATLSLQPTLLGE